MAGKATTRQLAAPVTQQMGRMMREAALLLLMAVAGYLLLSLFTYDPADPGWSHARPVDQPSNAGGIVGAYWADLSLFLFGYLAYLFPILLGLLATLIYRWQRRDGRVHWGIIGVRVAGFFLTLLSGATLAWLHIQPVAGTVPLSSGGVLGNLVGNQAEQAFSFAGATMLALAVFLAGVTLFTGLSWIALMDTLGRLALSQAQYLLLVRGWIQDFLEGRKAQRARET
ncbi:MAG: DNA translocase FtsK 4TM domain-containing protein, partial [Gammaproteobacteria bacterium]|nr:DNA translocase FtsK 4TM domain-containing protein [Gammaproteobacteria bacterium]